MAIYEITTDKGVYQIETEEKPQRQPADVVPTAEKVGALDQVFVGPSSAGTRELLRSDKLSNKLIGAIPMGIGSNLAGTGIFGKEAQSVVGGAFMRPSESETFQSEAIGKAQKKVAARAGKRTGLFAPDKPLGKALFTFDVMTRGMIPSAKGMLQDMYTNPIDWLLSAGDIASAGRAAKSGLGKIASSNQVNRIANMLRKATGRTAKGIQRGADVAYDNKKIVVGLEAMADYAKSQGKTINNAQDAAEIVTETKKAVRAQSNEMIKQANGKGASVDLNAVGNKLVDSQHGLAHKLADESLQTFAFEKGYELKATNSMPLDEAEEYLRILNSKRPQVISSMDDVTKAQLNETIASGLREQLDKSIFDALELGSNDIRYRVLKETQGSLIELDKEFAKAVIKAGKESGNSILRQLSESIDNVPLIYGVFSGNIKLAGAAAVQKTGKILLRKGTNARIQALFNTIDRVKSPKKFAPKLTPIGASRRIVPRKDSND